MGFQGKGSHMGVQGKRSHLGVKIQESHLGLQGWDFQLGFQGQFSLPVVQCKGFHQGVPGKSSLMGFHQGLLEFHLGVQNKWFHLERLPMYTPPRDAITLA